MALLEKRAAPKLVVQGGEYATHKRSSLLENVLPIQFPFGSGGPVLPRRTEISEELILKHYCSLSLKQFMKSDFLLITKSLLDRHLAYQTALLKCRPYFHSSAPATGEIIANMSVEEVQQAVLQEEEREKCLRQGVTYVKPTTGTTNAHQFLRAVKTS